MSIPNFKLLRGLAPDAFEHNPITLAKHCREHWKKLRATFPLATCLSECRSTSEITRKEILRRFSLPVEVETSTRKTIARGLYVLFDGKKATAENAFYVGIANDVPKRLAGHLGCHSSESSSLVYLLLRAHLPVDALQSGEMNRDGTPKLKTRKELFVEYRTKCKAIRDHLEEKCCVVIYPVRDLLTLHVLEAMVSLELKTGPWNSFKPH